MSFSHGTYFQELCDAYARAAAEPFTCYIAVAGSVIRLDFANAILYEQMFSALEHHQIDSQPEHDLCINIWDSESTGVDLPVPEHVRENRYIEAGERWAFNLRSDQSIRGYYCPGPNEYFNAIDMDQATAIYWRPEGRSVPYHEQSAPFLSILEWFFARGGKVLTHGAAVGNAQGGALIVGKSGRGKSTSAIACLFDSDMFYLGDDYFLLGDAGGPQAFNIFQTGKLAPEHMRKRFPRLLTKVVNKQRTGEDKCLFYPGWHFKERLAFHLPLKIALLPQVTGCDEARLVPARPAELLVGFASSTLYQSKSGDNKTLQLLARTLGQLPCYTLEIGNDLESIPRCIADGIERYG